MNDLIACGVVLLSLGVLVLFIWHIKKNGYHDGF